MKTPSLSKTLIALSASTLLLGGCVTTGSPEVASGTTKYGDAKAVETVTNEFGSTDLQTIAETMARSLVQSPLLKGRPLITVAEVKNKTSEYIDTRSITDTIRAQLLKSGTVRFAVDTVAMQSQVDELSRQSQSGLYSKGKSAKMGKMEGAKFRLEGNIVSIVKKNADLKDVWYKFSLQLIDNESGTMEWADEKEIRKTSRR
jgi:uncharacterized protein (TIGR02722 family)